MEACIKQIKENRPKLSESSIKTYSNILRSLYKDVFDKDFDHHAFTKHQDKVLKHLEDVKFNVRKTVLSALVALTEGVVQHTYREMMIKDAHQYNAIQKQNVMTEIQKENWISWAEIEDHLEKLKSKYYYVFKEDKPSREEILNLQKYIVLCCYVLIPPRRALDYICMKVKSYDKAKDNFYDTGKFHFRKYKTAKFTGLQIEKVPQGLAQLLKKWITFHNEEFLFSDYYGKELTSSGMTKILNSVFKPKAISVNQLRHIYITEKSAPLMEALEKTATSMGHSTAQAKLYVKHEE